MTLDRYNEDDALVTNTEIYIHDNVMLGLNAEVIYRCRYASDLKVDFSKRLANLRVCCPTSWRTRGNMDEARSGKYMK